jgi:hypothetical protein
MLVTGFLKLTEKPCVDTSQFCHQHKQNRDYEAMIRWLNAPPSDGEGEGEDEERAWVFVMVSGGFVRAVAGRGVDELVETGVSFEEVDEKERRRDGTPSRMAPPSATTGAASTALPSQPVALTKPARKTA